MSSWFITSPNMPKIPFIAIDRVSVRLRTDGRFGEEDFTQAPQIYSEKYPHRILIPARPSESSAESAMWWTPKQDNFERISRSSYTNLGRLRSSRLDMIDAITWNLRKRVFAMIARDPGKDWTVLEALVAHMRYGVMRLQHNPYTFQELVMDVAQTQRLYHDARSLCDYVQQDWSKKLNSLGPVAIPTRDDVMGAWSKDPTIVQQLHHAGIPVYFVRPLDAMGIDISASHPTAPCARANNIITEDWGLPARYSGLPGTASHAAVSSLNKYGDLEKYFYELDGRGDLQAVGERGDIHRTPALLPNVKTRSRKAKPIATGHSREVATTSLTVRDKWNELVGDFIPITIPHWSKAFKEVNKNDRAGIVAPKHFTGYRFPDPGMLVFSEVRREKNLFNWLLIRDASIRRLMHDIASDDGIPRGYSNELWRMILGVEFSDADKTAASTLTITAVPNSRNSAHADRRRAAIAIFGQPPDSHNQTEVQWRGHTVSWGSFFKHDPLLVQEVLWDVHQYSFQFDLIAQDRYLCPTLWSINARIRESLISEVVGCDSCFIVREKPTQSYGLGSGDDKERMQSYRSLDELMKPWPPTGGPAYSINDHLEYRDGVARRFCQAFSKAFGRPPILPKLVPVRNHLHCALAYKR
ncbi:hypothetical protein HWV62_38062 [Athelia sp. TMB]|nr:hypothetical protein HWV62_38062 [Athelia sp. TMB]